MSDEQNNIEESSFEVEESTEQPRKKGSFFSPLVIRILLIIALIITIIIIAILVFVIGSSITSGKYSKIMPEEWGLDIKRAPVIHLEYIPLEDPFRQQLLDGKMIQLKVTLGYRANNKKLQQEISQIKPEIRDIIIKHLSHMKSDYFVDESGSSLEKLEEDFLKQINRVLNEGKIERILFQEYTLM